MALMLLSTATQFISFIYVDEFKMSRSSKESKKSWALIRGGLSIEPEQPIGPEGRVYLGCRQHVLS